MKFAVHTDKGVFLVECKTPDEAREIVRKKHPRIVIGKVKVARSQLPTATAEARIP